MELGSAGWIRDDDAVDAVTVALNATFGHSIEVSQSPCLAPDGEPLKGYAKRQIARGHYSAFVHDAEKKLFGGYKPSWDQARGTCVSQGTGRAAQDAWYFALAERGEVGRPVEIACEAIYGLGRVQVGQGRLGRAVPWGTPCSNCGDGLVVAWAIQAIVKYGLTPRGVYGKYDLSKPNERLSIEWCQPGVGAPAEVVEAGRNIKVRVFRCMSGDDVADCAWAGHPMVHGYTSTYSDKNADGISRLNQSSNHSTEDIGGCVTAGGNTLIGGQQSWKRAGSPRGPNKIRYKGGVHELREGMCMFPVEDADYAIRRGAEWWAIEIEHGKGFRPE